MPPKPLPPTPSGRLIATVLSAYDLPDGSQPLCVSLRVLGSEVRTGPPAARHKSNNSFKFFGRSSSSAASAVSESSSRSTPDRNELTICAPLSALYPETVTLRVTYPASGGDGKAPSSTSSSSSSDLIASVSLKKELRVNETQWVVMDLVSDDGGGKGDDAAGGGEKGPDGGAQKSAAVPQGGQQGPTLRVKLRLEGPYRPEIRAVMKLSGMWFDTVDSVSDALINVVRSVSSDLPAKFPPAKLLLVPGVPLAGLGVALLPIAAGLLILGLPFLLPLLVLLGAIALSFSGAIVGMYLSTRGGRKRLDPLLRPAFSTLVSTSAGQSLAYETGPRPNPVDTARSMLPRDAGGRLVTSLLIDLIGSSSYLLPLVGEAFDLIWAPAQAVLVAAMYDDVSPSLKYISFAEEALPFTDFVPSATYGWLREFGPGLLDNGRKVVNDMKVVARGEKEALQRRAV